MVSVFKGVKVEILHVGWPGDRQLTTVLTGEIGGDPKVVSQVTKLEVYQKNPKQHGGFKKKYFIICFAKLAVNIVFCFY